MAQEEVQAGLPYSWAEVPLGDLADVNPPRPDTSGLSDDDEVTFVPMRNVEGGTGRADYSLARPLSEVARGYTGFREGDVLFAKITPCMENGKATVVGGLKNGFGFGSTEFHVIRLPEGIPPRYVLLYLLQESVRHEARTQMTGSAGQLRVPADFMRQLRLPLPPLPEQHRIVAKLEELFTRLDAGVDALERVQALLERYRQAVLRDAFSGRLTAAWREAHRDELEPASVLLGRIRREREAAPKRRGRGRSELAPLDITGLPELPEGWEWTRLPDIGDLDRGKSRHRPRNDPRLYGGPYPFVQTGDIRNANGRLHEYAQTYNELGLRQSRLWPRGTLCITIAANIADTAILDIEACFPDSVVGFTAETSHCSVPLVELYFRALKRDLEYLAPATAQKNINLAVLRDVLVPFPPRREQDEIVMEAERRLSLADAVERTVKDDLARANRLRQAVLRRAFEGKLVRQDPTDEPADKLLERIRAERRAQGRLL